jgi:hypothetical protein
MAYTRYAQKQSKVEGPKSKQPQSFRPWTLDPRLLAFACGLMSKPMVVTLPFVLLLLDFWPFRVHSTLNPQFHQPNQPSG